MENQNTLAERIESLGEKNDYKGQAEAFLHETGVLFEIVKAVPQQSPRWAKDGKHGTCYSVTLAKLKEKPREGQYIGSIAYNRGHIAKEIQFFFWNSIAEKQKAEERLGYLDKPKAYDVLACLYMRADTFEDFCANFGYSEDSREAEKTYNEVREQNAKLESIFSPAELEALAYIV
jgi:hypothetical protein